MGKEASELIEKKARRVQDRVFYRTQVHLSENLDTFPVMGMGFSFMRSSAEKKLEEHMEEKLLPVIDEHLDVQMELARELTGKRDKEEVVEDYEERLLDTDPLWDVLEPDIDREKAREEILQANIEACSRAARWMEEAGEEEFDDFEDLISSLDRNPEQAVEELNEILYYVEMMEKYRESLDLSGYSSFLESGERREWFLENLLEGLKISEEEALEEVREELQ
ncbi:MAG: hypothetical protein MUP63_03945 [Candidatus Nanohaloarchaeota archaeon QJJ-7]|nr:hypothetical protein [Candidatus Nanohaloarchaeota archaeon QJJ-7]